ncbi:MAG: hypothetical protein D6805_09915 [Planctomycetota bacterium]|nr:MAG: hypothetical protein D6805_09915 [Planctomycetota bacterium]
MLAQGISNKVLPKSDIQIVFQSQDRRYVTCIRHFIASFTVLKTQNQDVAYNVAMVANELVQNAVDHSLPNTSGIVKIEYSKDSIFITIWNEASDKNYRNLLSTLKQIENSAQQYYLGQVQKGSAAKLGLVRVVNDFGAQLKIHQEQHKVKVQAIFPLTS